MLADHLDFIPAELKVRAQWVCWRPDKTPVNPRTGSNAKANDPTTWGEFNQAVHYWQTHKGNGIAGVGYEFSPLCPFSGVDLDRCLNPGTGKIEPWAREIITQLNSYTETSPSGLGLHILIKGKLPPGPRRKGRVEMYSEGRYFTVTGQHLEGTPTTIEERQTELEALYTEILVQKKMYLPKGDSPFTNIDLIDSELIEEACQAPNGQKFKKLWRGDWRSLGYPSQSEADLALCAILAFWTGSDPAKVDRLFRQSGLMRKKWDRPTAGTTYGAKTIEKALPYGRGLPR